MAHLWLVDPDAWTLEGFENRDGHWLLLAALKDDEVRVPAFTPSRSRSGALGRLSDVGAWS